MILCDVWTLVQLVCNKVRVDRNVKIVVGVVSQCRMGGGRLQIKDSSEHVSQNVCNMSTKLDRYLYSQSF